MLVAASAVLLGAETALNRVVLPLLLEPGRRTDRVLHAVICEGCRWDYTS